MFYLFIFSVFFFFSLNKQVTTPNCKTLDLRGKNQVSNVADLINQGTATWKIDLILQAL